MLWEEDGFTVGELGKKLSLDNGTLTPLLKKMEQQGFIKRLRSTADERVVTVSLTTAGFALREQARDIPRCVSGRIGLPPEDAGCCTDCCIGCLTNCDPTGFTPVEQELVPGSMVFH